MGALVKGFICPEMNFKGGQYIPADDFFRMNLVAERRVDASPLEVLRATIHDFKIESYLGASPWMVVCGGDRKYLGISKLDLGSNVGTISDLLTCPDFQPLRRKQPLTVEQRKHLVDGILCYLSPENYTGIGIPNVVNVSSIYCDVLNSLGHNISEREIEDMMRVQSEIADREDMKDRLRRGQDWSKLAGQVVGAEIRV